MIQYSRGGWELRDLNSTNGTFVGGRRVTSERILLTAGMEFALGGRDLALTLVDAAPPVASAHRVGSGEIRSAIQGVLLLPDDDHPSVIIFERFDGKWIAESADEQRVFSDREILVVDGVAWRLELPAPNTSTFDTSEVGPSIDTIGLRFAVSRNEEHIQLAMLHDGDTIPIPSRTYHYLLLTLARAWLADASSSPEDRGWVDREHLCRMLSIDGGKLNVDIHRARGQFAALEVHRAAALIARRLNAGQLRLGVRYVEVVRLWFSPAEDISESPAPSESKPSEPGESK